MSHYSGSVPDTTHPVGWRLRATCRGKWAAMHPDSDEREIAQAWAICHGCPVARECFWDAVATDDMTHGMRAGLLPKERRAVVKELERRRAEKAARSAELAA